LGLEVGRGLPELADVVDDHEDVWPGLGSRSRLARLPGAGALVEQCPKFTEQARSGLGLAAADDSADARQAIQLKQAAAVEVKAVELAAIWSFGRGERQYQRLQQGRCTGPGC